MDCANPRYLPWLDMAVDCGKCLACRTNKQNEWISRLQISQQHSQSCYFVTLTYSPEHLPIDDNGEPCFDGTHIVHFNKLLRKHLKKGSFISHNEFGNVRISLQDRPIKFYLIGEYGASGEGHRPHYHAIYFDLPEDINTAYLLARECWPYGFVELSEACEERLRYVVTYSSALCIEALWPEGRMKPIQRVSKGIGIEVLENDLSWWHASPHNRVYIPSHGDKLRMGRYLKEKIFDEYQRERIAQEFKKREAQAPVLNPEEVERKRLSYDEFVRQQTNSILKRKMHI